MENFKGVSKQKRKKNIKRLSFIITQFKIEFLLLPVVGKCLCLKKCLIIKYKILHIQFSETICSKKLDQNLALYTIFTIYLGLLIRLRVSHLSEHKFNHNFDDCVNPFCTCRNLSQHHTFFALPSL